MKKLGLFVVLALTSCTDLDVDSSAQEVAENPDYLVVGNWHCRVFYSNAPPYVAHVTHARISLTKDGDDATMVYIEDAGADPQPALPRLVTRSWRFLGPPNRLGNAPISISGNEIDATEASGVGFFNNILGFNATGTFKLNGVTHDWREHGFHGVPIEQDLWVLDWQIDGAMYRRAICDRTTGPFPMP